MPADRQASAAAPTTWAVSATTGVRRAPDAASRSRISRVASNPSRTGIEPSISTRSYVRAAAMSAASRAVIGEIRRDAQLLQGGQRDFAVDLAVVGDEHGKAGEAGHRRRCPRSFPAAPPDRGRGRSPRPLPRDRPGASGHESEAAMRPPESSGRTSSAGLATTTTRSPRPERARAASAEATTIPAPAATSASGWAPRWRHRSQLPPGSPRRSPVSQARAARRRRVPALPDRSQATRSGRGLGHRQHEGEAGAFARRARHPDAPAHRADQPARDRKPEARAAELARRRLVGLG